MTYAQLALLFVAGLAASVHCLGMCSAFAVAAGHRGVLLAALYNLGRLFSYAAAGAMVGAVGKPLWTLATVSGLQGALTVILGVAMIFLGLRLLGVVSWSATSGGFRVPRFFTDSVSGLMPPTGPSQALSLGVLNGLLPCPVVHAFLPIAFAAGSLQGGAVAMLSLGLGTLPAMFAIGLLGSVRKPGLFQGWLARGPGVALTLFGVITVFRIGIPWLLHGFHHNVGLL